MHPINSFILELLVEHQRISPGEAEVVQGSVEASFDGNVLERRLYDAVVADTNVSEDDVIRILAEAEGLEAGTAEMQLAPETIAVLRERLGSETASKFGICPIRFDDTHLTVAVTYPCNYDELETVAHLVDMDLEVCLVSKLRLGDLMDQVYDWKGCLSGEREADVPNPLSSKLHAFEDVLAVNEERPVGVDADDEGSVSRYVDWIIGNAIKRRASDIHFEPMESHFLIRCRVDGVLEQLDSPPKVLQGAVLSRVKLMSHIDIAEKRMPQDGRFHLDLEGKDYDFRVSTVPSTHGEGIVIRVLDKSRLNIGLSDLGMLDTHRNLFERVITAPDGIFLVTGPTGSGKSTTLYSALNFINDPSVKIITVEDPVEYHIEGINQVQVRNEVNMTFSAALRSMLRQAPNIIMVGEIRDKETAEIAINASLTGHTVFSTLHTNDAPSAITRLIDMGTKPFLVAAALRAVLAQRLVRQIPEKHRIPVDVMPWQLNALGPDYEFLKGRQFYQAGEDQRSFHGRLGLFELFEVDDALSDVIYKNGSLSEIRNHLNTNGFMNMRHDGVMKASMGWTSIEEVLAVTPSDESTLNSSIQ